MRRILTTLRIAALVMCIATAARANPPEEDILRPRIPTLGDFFVEVDAGLNVTWFDGNPIYRAFFPSEEESRLFRSGFGLDPYGSASFGMRLTPAIRLRLRADYDNRSMSRSGTTIDSCPLFDALTGVQIGSLPVEVDKSFSLAITYATISLLAEYRMDPLFIFLGPSYSIPLSRRFSEDDRITDDESICMYFHDTPDTTRHIRAEVEGIDNMSSVLGIKVGAGMLIPMSEELSLVPQIGLDLPLASALKQDEPYTFRPASGGGTGENGTRLNRHMYFRALQASIGLRYNF
jgi:hypothetical protein